jgi:hypothetical protein
LESEVDVENEDEKVITASLELTSKQNAIKVDKTACSLRI